MAPKFKGRIDVDIRDSVPDWDPYVAPKAREGAPNVLMIAWDDLGYATMDIYGGPVECPTMRRIAERGVVFGELPHHSAVLADTRVVAHRSQRDDQRHGDDRGVLVGVPGDLHAYPVRERDDLRGARRARATTRTASGSGTSRRVRRSTSRRTRVGGRSVVASSVSTAISAARRTPGTPTSSTTTTRSRPLRGPRTATTSPTTWPTGRSRSSRTRR